MYDVAAGHAAGLIAPAILTPVAWLVLRGSARYRESPPLLRLGCVFLLISGFVHLGLVPAHLAGTPITASLFAIDGTLLIGLGFAPSERAWWRRVVIAVILGNLAAYIIWLIAGWEVADQVGVACKLVELVALGLVLRLSGNRRRGWVRRTLRAVALPLTTVVTSFGILVGGYAHPDALHVHAGALLQPANLVPTGSQRAAAARLLSTVRTAIAPYRDPQRAIADGYRPGPASDADPLLHWGNPRNTAVLDPAHPQDLVYLRTPHGLMLLGAMFQMPKAGEWGPDPGGPLTQWHQHEGICVSPIGIEFSFATPFWGCPMGAITLTTPPMLHVWLVDNPKGAFSADFDPKLEHTLEGQ